MPCQCSRKLRRLRPATLLWGCQHPAVRPTGSGKSHLSAALGLALLENGWRVMFARTSDLVQRFQVARRELALESTIARLDRYDVLILDDIVYVIKDQAETGVLFEVDRRTLRATIHDHGQLGCDGSRCCIDQGWSSGPFYPRICALRELAPKDSPRRLVCLSNRNS
jgi:hypothetical protein